MSGLLLISLNSSVLPSYGASKRNCNSFPADLWLFSCYLHIPAANTTDFVRDFKFPPRSRWELRFFWVITQGVAVIPYWLLGTSSRVRNPRRKPATAARGAGTRKPYPRFLQLLRHIRSQKSRPGVTGFLLGFLTVGDRTDRLSRNAGKVLPLLAE